ncbi:sigma factor G inhibitor Gin [Clostridium sp. MSJ-4]|uniref:Sigma factor G inhibitor Gin n=1 Tax=Clostridium simiarum TaxID=2841506 RepID=A0ABS6F2C6_9CLOT|nr:sigma factor G inhibitor Gin [Clostridium simiarum]MBU5591697.1 sigma factor G inhibitor Gin [Clostridium simiarum]
MSKGICILCRKSINDGIIINGKYICKACEDRLVNANVETDFYEYYKECIKKHLVEHMVKSNYLNMEQYRG